MDFLFQGFVQCTEFPIEFLSLRLFFRFFCVVLLRLGLVMIQLRFRSILVHFRPGFILSQVLESISSSTVFTADKCKLILNDTGLS